MAFLFGSRKKTPEQLVGLAVTALHELSEADDGTAEADTAKLQGDLKKRLSQMVVKRATWHVFNLMRREVCVILQHQRQITPLDADGAGPSTTLGDHRTWGL